MSNFIIKDVGLEVNYKNKTIKGPITYRLYEIMKAAYTRKAVGCLPLVEHNGELILMSDWKHIK